VLCPGLLSQPPHCRDSLAGDVPDTLASTRDGLGAKIQLQYFPNTLL